MSAQNDRRCDVCDGTLIVGLAYARDPQTGEAFSILRCTQCGLGHTTPQPDDLDHHYGPAYHGGRHGVTERFCIARRMRFVKSIGAPTSVLDFGCGDGGFLRAAAKSGWIARGVETKPERARSSGLSVAERLEDVTGQFDLITLWHSLEHVRSPTALFAALMPHLAQQGHVIVAVPNFASIQARLFGAAWFHLDVPRHLFHFTPMALERLFSAHGLQVIQRWNLESELDLFGWTQSSLNLILSHPNVLFDTLTRRNTPHRPGEIAISLTLGSLVTAASLPVMGLCAGVSRGAIVIFAGRRVGA